MASTSPVVSQSLEKELHRRYSNREIKTKRVLQIWIAKKTNPTNPGRTVTWEEKGEMWYTWVTQMFLFLRALLYFGKVLKVPSFIFFFSSTITEHVLAKRVYHTDVWKQWCHNSSVSAVSHTVGYWLSARVFLQGTLKNLQGEECFASSS